MERRAMSAPRPRGAAPRQRGRGAQRGRRQSRRPESKPKRQPERPGWDEDTRAPSLFDTQLRHIFRREVREIREERESGGGRAGRIGRSESQPVSVPRVQHVATTYPRHRPGQLRQRLQGSMVRPVERPEPDVIPSPRVVQQVQVQGPAVEPVHRPHWDLNPPVLNLPAQIPSAPEQLNIAHVQRRRNATLGERLAILLPQAQPLPQDLGASARNVVVMPGTLHRSTTPSKPQIAHITAPETPEKVQKLSQKLSALLGDGNVGPSIPSKQIVKSALSNKELLQQNSSKVASQADLLVDFVLEQIVGDSVKQLDTIPSKVVDPVEDTPPGQLREVEPLVEDTTLTRMVQSATDKLLLFEHELRMTYGDGKAKQAWTTPVRRKEPDHSESEDEGWRVASLPAQRVLELERYRARFAHHCMAAREAGIQSGPGSRTATWVIWPFLADSVAMAVVESAIEDVDNAMDDYVDNLIQDEVGCPGERTKLS